MRKKLAILLSTVSFAVLVMVSTGVTQASAAELPTENFNVQNHGFGS